MFFKQWDQSMCPWPSTPRGTRVCTGWRLFFLARRSIVGGRRLLDRGRGHEDLLRLRVTIYISSRTMTRTYLGSGIFVAELHLPVAVSRSGAGWRLVGCLEAGGQRLLWGLFVVNHTRAGDEVGEG